MASDSLASKSAELTITEVISADVIRDLKLSADASRVVYCVSPHYKSGDHVVSALWLAETAVEGSARKLTPGDTNDHSPRFHPLSSDIYFLSDREKQGGSSHIYRLPSDATIDSSPELVVALDASESVSYFLVSRDGNFLAFISQTHSREPGSKEPISLWREEDDMGSLRLVDLRQNDKQPRTLVSTDAHVSSFTWSHDNTSIIYRTKSHPDYESRPEPGIETVVSIDTAHTRETFTPPQILTSETYWRENGDLVFLQNTSPNLLSSSSLWTRSTPSSSPVHLAYGLAEDAFGLVDIGAASQYAVHVASGLDSRLEVFDADHQPFTAYETSEDDISYWDMKAVGDRYVFAAFRSSGVRGEPVDVWSGETQKGKTGLLTKKLSSHHTWLSPDRAPMSRPFYWTGVDGQSLQGVISYPRGIQPKKMPTVVVPHGGPTSRDSLNLTFEDWAWRQFLASRGYLVLSPNYRGSVGRGDKFVEPANGRVGTLDWEDTQSMVDAGIAQGIVDPEKIALAGYSQGGFLTAWGCTRPNSPFKTGVVGAGVTDWGILAATSDLPDIEAALAGGAPWKSGEATYRSGSPLKDCKNVRVPLLLLHGKEDKRVPVTQAIAFLRGIEREASSAPRPRLVIYPREDHIFAERANAEDVLRRLVEHLDRHLK